MDVTLNDPKKAAEITKYLQTLPGVKKVINEYANPSSRSTGGHLHVEADAKTNAELKKMLGETVMATAKASEKATVASAKVSEKQKDSSLASTAPKINEARTQMITNFPAAVQFANLNKPQEMGPPAPTKMESFSDAISSLGDRLSGHFENLIGHTADGNADLKKLQKSTA